MPRKGDIEPIWNVGQKKSSAGEGSIFFKSDALEERGNSKNLNQRASCR